MHDDAPTEPTDTNGLTWHKSSYSGGPGSDCVEVAHTVGTLYVRDSKNPTGPALDFPVPAFAAFLAEVKAGRFTI